MKIAVAGSTGHRVRPLRRWLWRGGGSPRAGRDVFEKGGLLPGPGATLAGPTFEDWLDTEDAALNVIAAH